KTHSFITRRSPHDQGLSIRLEYLRSTSDEICAGIKELSSWGRDETDAGSEGGLRMGLLAAGLFLLLGDRRKRERERAHILSAASRERGAIPRMRFEGKFNVMRIRIMEMSFFALRDAVAPYLMTSGGYHCRHIKREQYTIPMQPFPAEAEVLSCFLAGVVISVCRWPPFAVICSVPAVLCVVPRCGVFCCWCVDARKLFDIVLYQRRTKKSNAKR
ncbi:hypothetical protein CCUS01_11195, partial [Colletotrichum cuscutae]